MSPYIGYVDKIVPSINEKSEIFTLRDLYSILD